MSFFAQERARPPSSTHNLEDNSLKFQGNALLGEGAEGCFVRVEDELDERSVFLQVLCNLGHLPGKQQMERGKREMEEILRTVEMRGRK